MKQRPDLQFQCARIEMEFIKEDNYNSELQFLKVTADGINQQDKQFAIKTDYWTFDDVRELEHIIEDFKQRLPQNLKRD